ncbi:nitroreductase [Brevibacillus porteri]|uniref:Nitroreductase n=1 Tax=Brevibacillus porteri TaxID=2126350 RepID=A0ABX5FVA5_9BACL|nr:nitroreductase [Brevibacillus porteri]MED1798834.1 nitroreductase [Brevibacillus porteri]MED2131517.1 nitroreductase [Brevibacillus porteri]MED2744070.1 nitroreductase [Brevibacillus porteri]MED2813284.1 nitroreductase [Brevibacillus porteri]MED2896602.1 nitroreductase [Brevibacillus porteri]
MLELSCILLEGALLSVVFLVILLVTLYYNPRIWLKDYPKDIQQAVKERTKKETRQFTYIGTLIMALVAVPFITSLYYTGDQVTFAGAFLHFYIVFTIVSLVDLLILDWFVFCWITPRFIIIPGSNGAKGYKDYRFHFIGFLKGAVIYVVLALILAVLRVLVAYF